SDAVNDDENEVRDVFVREVAAKITRRFNLSPNGDEANGTGQAPLPTSDGRWILFMNQADNLVDGGVEQLLIGPVGPSSGRGPERASRYCLGPAFSRQERRVSHDVLLIKSQIGWRGE